MKEYKLLGALNMKKKKSQTAALKPNLAFDIKFQKVNGIKRQV